MVNVLASSAVDRGFEPRSGQSKDYIQLVFITSPLSTQHYGKTAKIGLLEIRIMCPSEVTYLSTDCCISELALNNPTQRVGLVQSGTHHYLIEN